MVILDMANTRLKDFLDIWTLARGQQFSGSALGKAVEATFRRRSTPLPASSPLAFTPAFHSAAVKQAQWQAYLRKARVQGKVPSLDKVANDIERFAMPIVAALATGSTLPTRWLPGGPWRSTGDDDSTP